MLTLAVAVAAGLGALARHLVDQVVQHRTHGQFPYGTFAVNASGSLLLGLTAGLANHRGLPCTGETVFGIGFLGGYTTLSTWAWESLALTLDDDGGLGRAALNVIGTLTVCAATAAVGLGITLL